MEQIITVFLFALEILRWIVLIYAILSWVMPPTDPIRETLARIVDPLVAPIRQIVPPIGGIDLSLIVLFFLLEIVRRFLFAVI